METPRLTPPQSQLSQDEFRVHSGYGSPPGSPGGRSALVASLIPDRTLLAAPSYEPIIPAKPVPLHSDTIQGMHKFERRVTEEMQRRFKDVLDRLSGPLAAYLRRSRHEHRPTVIRLVFLGYDADSVRPWIVVLCPELVKKKAEKFFNKDMARRVYQSDDPGRESFQVIVVGQPPRARAGESASYVQVALPYSAYPDYTPRSLHVKAEHDGVSRWATIGGFIVASCHDGIETAYGLTAGHLVPQTGYVSPSSEGSMPSPAPSDSDDEGTITPEPSDQTRHRRPLGSSIGLSSESSWTDVRLANASFSREARNRDWALIEGIRTNQVKSFNICANPNAKIELGTIGEQRSLQIGFEAGRTLHCILSQTPSMILTPTGHDFIPAHILILDAAQRLSDGTSGTWVISEAEDPWSLMHTTSWPPSITSVRPASKTSVYGQVVADDMFGDVYMIPLQGIMDDIKTLLDAAVVRLPASSKELRQILMTQLHREHMNPDCEESSKDSHAPITNGTALPNNYGSTSTVIPESAFVNTSTNSQSHAEPLDADHVHKSRSHVCAICARSFKRLGHFKRHERTHTQEKNSFECPQCQEFFERKDLLIRHQRKHNHSEIDSKDKDVPTTNGKARQEVGDYSFIPRKAYSTYFESFRSSGDSETESLGICSPQPLSDGEFYEESEISANSDKAPKAKKSRTEAPWTSKEDQCLKQMRSDGASWDRITEKFWDRPKGSVKRHWYKDLNREGMAEAASAPASVPEQGK